MMRKGGSNWVDGENFFDWKNDLEAMEQRVREGTHTLLTAQRRMGKTSLVRELQRRLAESGEYEVVFVDLEAAADPADAIAEIGFQARSVNAAWTRIKSAFKNSLALAFEKIDELSIADLKVKLRAGIDAGNWRQRGDTVFAALAESQKPVIVAIDELPILINRMLKDETGHVTPESRKDVDLFLSWLRMMGQSHKGQVILILSGSISLEPLLEEAGLSSQVNIFSSYDLMPWNEAMAVDCIGKLAESYKLRLSRKVRLDMCRRLRTCIPHHVQMFFDKMHDHLRSAQRIKATLEDVEKVYERDMQGIRGQADLQHYEDRLNTVLGESRNIVALEILTVAACEGRIFAETVGHFRKYYAKQDEHHSEAMSSVDYVLRRLQHDGYLVAEDNSYRFVSGLLEDWWRRRYGDNFQTVIDRLRWEEGLVR